MGWLPCLGVYIADFSLIDSVAGQKVYFFKLSRLCLGLHVKKIKKNCCHTVSVLDVTRLITYEK